MSLPTIVDLGQRVGAVADQRGALHRGGHLAVLDQVRLADAENTNLPDVMSTWPPPKFTA